jgi:hypothetical protein
MHSNDVGKTLYLNVLVGYTKAASRRDFTPHVNTLEGPFGTLQYAME